MQKHVNLVDLVKSFPTNIFLQNLASIQRRTSPVKFAHLAEQLGNGSISNLSTKEQTVKDLQAEITSLSADRDSLDQNIQDLTKEIADYEADIKEAAEIRAEEKATFEAALADVIKSVTQLEKAVETLKASALLQGKSSSSTLAHVQGMMKTAVNMADAMGLVEQNSGSERS